MTEVEKAEKKNASARSKEKKETGEQSAEGSRKTDAGRVKKQKQRSNRRRERRRKKTHASWPRRTQATKKVGSRRVEGVGGMTKPRRKRGLHKKRPPPLFRTSSKKKTQKKKNTTSQARFQGSKPKKPEVPNPDWSPGPHQQEKEGKTPRLKTNQTNPRGERQWKVGGGKSLAKILLQKIKKG